MLYYIGCDSVYCSIWLNFIEFVLGSSFFWRGNEGVGVFLVEVGFVEEDLWFFVGKMFNVVIIKFYRK